MPNLTSCCTTSETPLPASNASGCPDHDNAASGVVAQQDGDLIYSHDTPARLASARHGTSYLPIT
jgi:hypothetical protein